MKKMGLIGGLSWVSTAEYYRRINEITQEMLGGVTSASLILESLNRQQYFDAVIDRDDDKAACQIVIDAAMAIEKGGAEFIVITCNGAHRFVPETETHISIPFLHIAEVTACAIKSENMKTVALTGVRETMDGTFYPEILKRHGITTIIPNEEEKTFIQVSVMNELTQNIFSQETRDHYSSIFSNLQSRGAEGVILGCTEIPLLLSDDDVGMKTFSTTEIHCQAAVNMALS